MMVRYLCMQFTNTQDKRGCCLFGFGMIILLPPQWRHTEVHRKHVIKSIVMRVMVSLAFLWMLVVLQSTLDPRHNEADDMHDMATTTIPETYVVRQRQPIQQQQQQQQQQWTNLFTCPATVVSTKAVTAFTNTSTTTTTTTTTASSTIANADEAAFYAAANSPLRQKWDTFVETFQRTDSKFFYDGWGFNYATVKLGMTDFKVTQWQSLLASRRQEQQHEQYETHDEPLLIYESAAGIGLNLLLTTQILREELHDTTTPVVLYGNEYLNESVALAYDLYHRHPPVHPPNTTLGTLCAHDSRDLSYVPSNTFDLVMSGYITPLQNPLEMDGDNWYGQTLRDICPNATAVAHMQRIQESWYNQWVQEMIRIAKPGGSIWVEQVSPPLCTPNVKDWGGVDANFWTQSANLVWNKDVVPSSLVFMPDHYLHPARYHVAMQKRDMPQ